MLNFKLANANINITLLLILLKLNKKAVYTMLIKADIINNISISVLNIKRILKKLLKPLKLKITKLYFILSIKRLSNLFKVVILFSIYIYAKKAFKAKQF